MSQRFISNKKTSYLRNFILSCLFFLLILSAFFLGTSSFQKRVDKEGISTLQDAVTRSITRCYAEEGSYPETLNYLKEHYGLTYDESTYYVDYQPLGSNIMPDITIIQKQQKGGH